MSSDSSQPAKVAIIGGGVAALEAMLALDATSYSGADVHLFSPRTRFVLKPLAVLDGFGRGSLLNFDLPKLTATAGATFHNASVSEVDTDGRVIVLSDDSTFNYDYLIASQGTKSLSSVPGATIYWGPAGNQAVTEALGTLRDRKDAKVVVTMPEGGTWPLPIYELALLIEAELGPGHSMAIVTPEKAVLEPFGKAANQKVTALLRNRDIETILETAPDEYRDGVLLTTDGRRIEADLAAALPLLTGQRIPGLPYDVQGFIPVNEFGQIQQHSREFAAGRRHLFSGQVWALATEQADVVAAAIAAAAWHGPPPRPFEAVYRGTLATPDGLIDLGPGAGISEPDAWDPTEKVFGKYLTPFLKAADPAVLGTQE